MNFDDIDFTYNDWLEVQSRFKELSLKETGQIISDYYKLHPEPVNEFSFNCSNFRSECANNAMQIHFNVINICFLGLVCLENIQHWKSELFAMSRKIIYGFVQKQVKRADIAYREIIFPYMIHETYQYDEDFVYRCIKTELKKADKSNATNRQKLEAKVILSKVVPNISKILTANQNRISKLFKAFIKACELEDWDIFEEAVDKFIETEIDIL